MVRGGVIRRVGTCARTSGRCSDAVRSATRRDREKDIFRRRPQRIWLVLSFESITVPEWPDFGRERHWPARTAEPNKSPRTGSKRRAHGLAPCISSTVPRVARICLKPAARSHRAHIPVLCRHEMNPECGPWPLSYTSRLVTPSDHIGCTRCTSPVHGQRPAHA